MAMVSTKCVLLACILLLGGCVNVSATAWATYTPPLPAAQVGLPAFFIPPELLPKVVLTPRGPIFIIFGDCL